MRSISARAALWLGQNPEQWEESTETRYEIDGTAAHLLSVLNFAIDINGRGVKLLLSH